MRYIANQFVVFALLRPPATPGFSVGLLKYAGATWVGAYPYGDGIG